MISSMTGFGKCEKEIENGKIRVEIKSVNHRYLDLNLRINHRFSEFENKIRNLLKSRISRGKVDFSLSIFTTVDDNCEIVYNKELAKQYLDNLEEMSKDFGIKNDITSTKLAHFNNVLVEQEKTEDVVSLWKDVESAINDCLDIFIESRVNEGENLKADLLDKLLVLEDCAKILEDRSPVIVNEYKNKLTEKVKDLIDGKDIDDSRIAMEVVIFADKICIDEEIVRLKSHIDSVKNCLVNENEVGRKLDFIAQEMNREANTILSKNSDPEISDMGIMLKTTIEKIREQIQNLE